MVKQLNSITFFIVIIFFLTSCQTNKVNETNDVVFKNINIITMTDENILENRSVYISDGIIQYIGEYDDIVISENIQIIDGSGKYLLPGFSDMHVHTYSDEDLLLFLSNGVTRVRNMFGFPEHIKKRSRIKKKKLLGPELFTASPIIDGENAFWPQSIIITDPTKVEKELIKLKNRGYDFIKIYNNLSKEVFFKILEEAEKLDIEVVGHVPKAVSINEALTSSMTSIEHFTGYNLDSNNIEDISESIELTATSNIWNCPTLYLLKIEQGMLDRSSLPEIFSRELNLNLKYVSKQQLKIWEESQGFENFYPMYKELLKILNDNNAKIISGTDQLCPYIIPGFSLHEEFKLMNEAGLTPYEVLKTTTVNPAIMLGIESRSGTIEVGKEADIVVLNENPLIDIKNTQNIYGVMTKGYWLSETAIANILKDIELIFKK